MPNHLTSCAIDLNWVVNSEKSTFFPCKSSNFYQFLNQKVDFRDFYSQIPGKLAPKSKNTVGKKLKAGSWATDFKIEIISNDFKWFESSNHLRFLNLSKWFVKSIEVSPNHFNSQLDCTSKIKSCHQLRTQASQTLQKKRI